MQAQTTETEKGPLGKAHITKNHGSPKRWDVYDTRGKLIGFNLKFEDARIQEISVNHPAAHRAYHRLFANLEHLPGATLNMPQHESRMFRALELVTAGAVSHDGQPNTYYVQSQSHPNILYRVTCGPRGWRCVMVDHPNASKKAEYCPDIANGQAPDFGHGPRCKHMLAVHFFREMAKNKAPAAPTAEASQDPKVPVHPHSTTPSDNPQAAPGHPSPVVARYADGRPARRADGTVIRYTAGGTPVELRLGGGPHD